MAALFQHDSIAGGRATLKTQFTHHDDSQRLHRSCMTKVVINWNYGPRPLHVDLTHACPSCAIEVPGADLN